MVGGGIVVVILGMGLFVFYQPSKQDAPSPAVVRPSPPESVSSAPRTESQLVPSASSASFRDSLKSGGQGPEMVRLPKGQFQMGSPAGEQNRANDEGPQHSVSIERAIALGRFELTRGEFERFVKETSYVTDAEKGKGCWTWSSGKWGEQPGANWRSVGFNQDATHPVVCVSWNDARAYADWLSEETGKRYRLPTEAE
jgi:formylglycine-generating enzyme required for sulfatase activity